MRSIKSLAIGAGFGFVTLAIFVQGFLPAILPESRTKRVSRAVRTDLGEIKWVRYESSDYTPLEKLGRAVYIREGCWYCHSQYVRPVAGEELRWGPVSEAGEYAFDLPHLFSTRRIGPDLTRVGLKYADDWHYAHHWDPRLVVPESIMPSFKWLFEQARVPVRKTSEGLELERTPAVARYFTMNEDKPVLLFPNETGLVSVRPRPDGELPIDGTPVLDLTPFADKPPVLTSVLLVVPTKELVGLVRYVQKLGTNRGAWREVFEPQNVALSVMGIPQSADLVAHGRRSSRSTASAATGRRATGTGSPLPSSSPGRATSPSECSSSARRRPGRCRPTATSSARSRAASAGPRCRRGMRSPTRIGSRSSRTSRPCPSGGRTRSRSRRSCSRRRRPPHRRSSPAARSST